MKQTVMKEISNILNKVKGLGTAHRTDNDQAMLISSNEVVYLCNIVDVGKGHINSYFSELADVEIPVFKNAQNILSTQERLIEIFNAVKGFEAGFITSRMDAFMLVHKNLAYGLFLQELDKEGLIDNIHELFTVSKQEDLESLSKSSFTETTIGNLVEKEEIENEVDVKLLEHIKGDSDVYNLGYTSCLGTIEKVYPSFSKEIMNVWHPTWIWENEKSQRIAIWGNTPYRYLCNGSFEAFSAYIKNHSDNGDLVTKKEIIEQVVLDLADAIKFDSDVFNLGFTKCLGKMEDVYPTFPENIKDDWYRTWIWENEKGQRIATWDDGNSHCSYMCEGSFDSVLSYLKGRIEELEYLK